MNKNIGIADNKVYQPYIDGLRGIAILMVLAVHTSQFCGNDGVQPFYFHTIGTVLNAGARGVQLFFIISAFTLFASSKIRFDQDAAPIRSFYLRRAFRILPFWWLITTVYALRSGAGRMHKLPTDLMYFGFIRYRPGLEAFPMGWSIFVEEIFYLLLPLIFRYVTDIYRAGWLLLITLCVSYEWDLQARHYQVPDGNSFIFLFPLSHWFCFALGILLYYIKNSRFYAAGIFNNREADWLFDAAAAGAAYFYLAGPLQQASIPMFLLFLSSVSETSICGRLTRHPLLRRFGTYCYSIYLSHLLLLIFMDRFKAPVFEALGISQGPIEPRFIVWYPVMAAVALAAGFLSFNLIEKPCVMLGKKAVAKFAGRVAAAA